MKKSKTRIYISKEISSNLLIYIKNKQHHFLRNVIRVQINETINNAVLSPEDKLMVEKYIFIKSEKLN